MDCKLTLRNLLRLDAGMMESVEREYFRAAIKQNANCAQVWRLMSQQAARLESDWARLSQPEWEHARVDAKLVAGYLDGTLGSEQAQRLERRALQEPLLMAELMLHFRGHREQADAGPLPWAATERLFALGESLKSGTGTAKSESPVERGSQHKAAATNSVVGPAGKLAPKPVKIQMARSVLPERFEPRPRPSRGRGRMWAAVLTAGAMFALVSLGWRAWQGAGPSLQSVAGGGNPTEGAPASTRESLANAENARAVTPRASGGTASGGTGRELASRPAQGGEGWALVSLQEDEDVSQPGWQIDPTASVFHQFSGNIVDCKWLALEGVIALREPGKNLWFGPKSTAQTANGLEWRTLPGSWATARLGGLGEIVLDSDSTVVVNASVPESLLALDLAAGRVGLKGLPANLKLQIKHDQANWELVVLEAGTSLGLDWLEGEPRLAVQNGLVQMGDQHLGRSEQLVWRATPDTDRGSDAARPLAGRLREQLAWLEKPKQEAFVSGATQAELLASGNMVAEMNRLRSSSALPEQVLAQHLPAILAPETHLLGALEGTDAKSRGEALEWLLSLPPRSPKTRQIWRSISQKSGAPELVPEYFRLVQLVRNSARLIEPDAEFLSAGLKHERLFVREMSQVLLELRFGNTVQYDAAESDARQRDKLAERWAREILAAYRPAAVPKR